jgi:hypothetical protein
MKLFLTLQIRDAKAYAAAGGQALHVFNFGRQGWLGAPAVFQRHAAAGRPWGHLFDQDRERVIATARRLGVKRIVVHHPGTPQQHVDLCGKPLNVAIAECEPLGVEEGSTNGTNDTKGKP